MGELLVLKSNLFDSSLSVSAVKMGRMPGPSDVNETDDDIKGGKQQKLNIGTLFRRDQGTFLPFHYF